MCRLRNIAMRDYQESVTTGQTDTQTDAGQSDPCVPLCFVGDTKTTDTDIVQNAILSSKYNILYMKKICAYNK